MAPFALDLEKTRTKSSLVRIEPAINAFGSMLLVAKQDDEPGIHEWVTKTYLQMSEEERFRHKLVTIGFHYSIMPQTSEGSFEAYLAALEATSPSELRERLLNAYAGICLTKEPPIDVNEPVDWDEVLVSARSYVGFLRN